MIPGIDLGRWLAYGAIALLLVAAGWLDGYRRGELKLYEYQGEQAAESVKIVVKQGEVTERVVTKYVRIKEKAGNAADGIRREVIRYVETNPSGMCLDDDWRRLHDAAAAGVLPAGAGGPDGAVRAPGADPAGTGDDGLQRTRHGDGELRAAPSLR